MYFVALCALQVNTGEYDPLYIEQSHGATMRLVRPVFRFPSRHFCCHLRVLQIFDFNNLNESLYVLPPGQSGNWFSDQYDSQGEAWCVPPTLFSHCCCGLLVYTCAMTFHCAGKRAATTRFAPQRRLARCSVW